jgi:hypothetical protein
MKFIPDLRLDRGSAIKIVLSFILALRCPLTALITYASNKKTN